METTETTATMRIDNNNNKTDDDRKKNGKTD